MPHTRHDVEEYVDQVVYPATKEELINGLLVRDAPRRMVALIERLPRDRYNSLEELRGDLNELVELHAREARQARTYEEFERIVLRHVGDVSHTTKRTYNDVAEHIIHLAEREGALNREEARTMLTRLEAGFAELRGSMTEVTNDSAPIDPAEDLPRMRE